MPFSLLDYAMLVIATTPIRLMLFPPFSQRASLA